MNSNIKSICKQVQMCAMLLLALTACEKGNNSYSLLPESQNFQQNVAYAPRKIDVLWVIDNSGSMQTSQTGLTTKFNSFAKRLVDLKFDFQMAVTTTDSFLGNYNGNPGLFKFRDGVGSSHSGFFILNNQTANLLANFTTNASQGVSGSGDERAFQSMQSALNYTGNAGFKRPGSHLAVIVLSDEDDFSATNGTNISPNYSAATLVPVSSYVSYLNSIAGTNNIAGGIHNWSFNTIGILDSTCLASLNTTFTGRRIGTRYLELSTISGGAKASLCGDFGASLELISNLIIEASSTYKLDREPVLGTIRVIVDGQSVTENKDNGWTYDTTTMVISFHGTATPAVNAVVTINYDPVKPKL